MDHGLWSLFLFFHPADLSIQCKHIQNQSDHNGYANSNHNIDFSIATHCIRHFNFILRKTYCADEQQQSHRQKTQ